MAKRWYFPLRSSYVPKITNWLNKLPVVRWDRISQKVGHIYAFGWIDREDEYKDFIVIDFVNGEPVDYVSSDIKYNLEHRRILGLFTQKCQRIEKCFPDVKNSIKLERKT